MFNRTRGFLSCAAAIYTAALLYYSSLPFTGAPGEPAALLGGNIAHFLAYAVYAVILLPAFSGIAKSRRALIMPVLAAAAVGGLAEAIQLFVPGRSCDLADWLTNMAGALAGLLLVYLFLKSKADSKKQGD